VTGCDRGGEADGSLDEELAARVHGRVQMKGNDSRY
jgi:hypothetical protein